MTTPPAPKKQRKSQNTQNESVICEEDEADSPFNLYFVQIPDASPKEKENLEILFKATQKSGLVPEWIDEEAMDRLHSSDDFFIFPCFRGKLFRKIQARKLRIFGPPILSECLEERKPLPDSRLPIYSSVFEGSKICFTNIGPEKRSDLLEKVAWMGGVISKNLYEETTHLVCGSSEMSDKYKTAIRYSVKLMQSKWIDDLWETSCTATGKFSGLERNSQDCYALPVFDGLKMVLSAIDGTDRMSLNQLIVENGGETFGNMRKTQCTHLITENTTSQKYKKAMEWGCVKIVTTRWIRKCIDLGHVIDEAKYHPRLISLEHMRSSTPKKDANMTSTGPDISSIQGHGGRLSFNSSVLTPMANSQNPPRFPFHASTSTNTISTSNLNVTESLRRKSSTTVLIRHSSTIVHNHQVVHDPIDELRMRIEGLDELFENCLFLMFGVEANQIDKWRRFLDGTGATRVSKIDSATHVIVLDPSAQEKATIRKFLNKEDIAIVNVQWVTECVEKKMVVGTDEYLWSESQVPDDTQSQPSVIIEQIPSNHRSEATPIATNKGIFASCTFYIDSSLGAKIELEKKVQLNGGIVENEPERAEFVVFGAMAPIQELLRFDAVVTDFYINSCICASKRLKLSDHPLFVPLPRPLSSILTQKKLTIRSSNQMLRDYVSEMVKSNGGQILEHPDSKSIDLWLDDMEEEASSKAVGLGWLVSSVLRNRVQSVEENCFSKEFERQDDIWMHCLRIRSPTQEMMKVEGKVEERIIKENIKTTGSCPMENPYFPDLRQPFKMRLNLDGAHEAINEIPSPVQIHTQESFTTSFVGRVLKKAVQNTGRGKVEQEEYEEMTEEKRPPSVVIAGNRRTVSSTPVLQRDKKRVPRVSDSLLAQHLEEVEALNREFETRRHFVLSSTENADELTRCIEALGGVVDKEFNAESTIFITGKLGRTTNNLSVIAAGRWCLTNDYVFESVDAGRWLSEEKFEWNREMLAAKGLEKDRFARQLAPAIGKWRRRIESMPVTHSVSTELRRNGAFTDWRCVVHLNDARAALICPIIEAGGGVVLPISEYSEVSTHRVTCVIANKTFPWNKKSAQQLKRDGIPLYTIDIVYEHLISEGSMQYQKQLHPSYPQ